MPATLLETLAPRSREGELVRELPDGRIECYACGHRCVLKEGRQGICKVRWVEGGKLFVPWGYVAGLQCDPIEKKPFFHALPGARALSFGMLGCDLHCAYCQNWVTSQALRDPVAGTPPLDVTPEAIVEAALAERAEVVTSTYNEPLITAEWAVAVFRRARQAGLTTSFVSNGNATPEVLAYLKPWVDLYKVDLKGFDDRRYRQLGGTLKAVCDTLQELVRLGFWVEVVTLVIPGFNDSDAELGELARFLVSVSPDLPWHVTAFHQDYKMADRDATSTRTLVRAAEIGRGAGLRFVYAGNQPGRVGELENTYCPSCRTLLVERRGYRILGMRLLDGRCPSCQLAVPGRWRSAAA